MSSVVFVVLLLLAAPAGYAPLRRLGLRPGEAWAGGRTAGLVLAAWAGWWVGVLGCSAWVLAGGAVGAVLLVWGVTALVHDRGEWRGWLCSEAVFVTGSLAVLWMRVGRPEIVDTEKLMDLGIGATLLRTGGFPPPDMWLAGEPLAYYYWGWLPWTVPLSVSGAPLEIGYNLTVAAVGGLVAVLAWSLAARLCGRRWALAAAYLAVFAGTPDGLRQWVADGAISLWASSRQVPHAITEFPLFTLWLGDLHPHLLSLPPALLSLLVAARVGERGPTASRTVALAVLFGVTWAANPWAMPPTLAGIGLLLAARAGVCRRTVVSGVAVAVAGWLVCAPFHLRFAPPFRGLAIVHDWTRPDRLLLYGGVVLVPAGLAAWRALGRTVAGDRTKVRAGRLAIAALLVLAAAVTARPSAVLLAAVLVALGRAAAGTSDVAERSALALASLGVFLFLVPEIVYVVDPYGEALHRMNTVFKSYFQGWFLLAVTFPVLLRHGLPRGGARAAVAAMLILVSVPHLWVVMTAPIDASSWSLDGLRWMTPGDRAAVRVLRRTPSGTVLAEAVGDAYSRHARLSSASGVPTVLGWGNHEIVWRGEWARDEVDRRRRAVERLYSCGDVVEIRRLGAELGVDVIAVGAMERQRYPEKGLRAVAAAGPTLLEGGTTLIQLSGGGSTG